MFKFSKYKEYLIGAFVTILVIGVFSWHTRNMLKAIAADPGNSIWTIGTAANGITVNTTGDILPRTTGTNDLGSAANEFEDGRFTGTLTTDILTVDETATIAGLTTVTGGLSYGSPTVYSASATVTSSACFGIHIATATEPMTFTLPVSTAVPEGNIIVIKWQPGAAKTLTLVCANSTDKIEGSTSNDTSMNADNDTTTLYNDSDNNDYIFIDTIRN